MYLCIFLKQEEQYTGIMITPSPKNVEHTFQHVCLWKAYKHLKMRCVWAVMMFLVSKEPEASSESEHSYFSK